MARRRKGRAVHGWLIVDKPAGITSTAVVNKARWAFGAQKAGHAGTLDPAATGLLAVAFGEATKTVPYITDADKCYEFTVRWGQATNTDDADGEVIRAAESRPTDVQILAALPTFTGDIMQVPPQFSAVKIGGQRAYALARDGEETELAARPLHVDSLSLTERPDPDTAVFEMVCGKGGYVRSIARDLGDVLGCLGHVVTLRRVWSGPFDLDGAITFEMLGDEPGNTGLDAHLKPLEAGLTDLPEQRIGDDGATRILNGNPGQVAATELEYGDICWVSLRGKPLAVGVYKAGYVHPNRVFQLS